MQKYLLMVAVLLIMVASPLATAASPTPVLRAHSHNDYQYQTPLVDALALGVCSIEADVHLVDGQLMVAHDKDEIKPGWTLEKLYLDPLLARVKKNGGQVYPGVSEVILLIDFKTPARATWEHLKGVLKNYKPMLTEFTDKKKKPGAVTVIISGNRPKRELWQDKKRLAAIDGRPDELRRDPSPTQMPLISASWGTVFDWNGRDDVPDKDREALKKLVKDCHDRGIKLRFWAAPRKKAVWNFLYDGGVDLLGADSDLPQLRDFLLERQ